MFPLFTNTILLGALAGLGIPVLIHLLLRRKSQRLRFSTIQFFVKKDEQSVRKRKLRNLLLLTARLILFALIVLAFARPYLPGSAAAAALRKRQQVILLLDSSLSMQASGPAGQQWTRAKELGRQILAGLQTDDRAALISCSTHSSTISGFAPASVVSRLLTELSPTFGTAELTEGLQHTLKVLATADPAYTSSLYIISDLQRNGCLNLSSCPMPPALTVKVLDLGERFIPNTSVSDLQIEAHGQTEPHATITSFSDENSSTLKTTLRIDGKELLAKAIELPASASTNIPLAIPALSPGWHSAEFSLAAKDGLPADDSRYQVVFVPPPLHVLVVEPRKSDKIYQEESFFVTMALNPGQGASDSPGARFALEKTTPDQLAQKMQPKPGEPRVDFVIVPGLKQISTAAVNALSSYVRSGGGIMLFLGETVSANHYNTALRELLPALIGKPEATLETDSGWRIGDYDKTSAMFSNFRQPNSGNLSIPEFTHRFALTPNPDATVAAEFDDDVPLIIERKVGEGKVALVNTSADTAWTDWPKHKTFVPWLHAAGRSLAGKAMAQGVEQPPAFVTGNDADFELGIPAAKQQFNLHRPGGKETILTADDRGRMRDILIDAPGIYSLYDPAGKEVRRLAANTPVQESDLATLAPTDFQQQIVRKSDSESPAFMAGLFGESSRGHELWRVLLLSALVLMIIEPIVANRTLA